MTSFEIINEKDKSIEVAVNQIQQSLGEVHNNIRVQSALETLFKNFDEVGGGTSY